MRNGKICLASLPSKSRGVFPCWCHNKRFVYRILNEFFSQFLHNNEQTESEHSISFSICWNIHTTYTHTFHGWLNFSQPTHHFTKVKKMRLILLRSCSRSIRASSTHTKSVVSWAQRYCTYKFISKIGDSQSDGIFAKWESADKYVWMKKNEQKEKERAIGRAGKAKKAAILKWEHA